MKKLFSKANWLLVALVLLCAALLGALIFMTRGMASSTAKEPAGSEEQAATAVAVDMVLPTYEEFYTQSSLIASGTVMGDSWVEEGITDGGMSSLFTCTQFQLSQVFQGDLQPSDVITVRTWGGEKGDQVVTVSTAPDLSAYEGEELVLFLSKSSSGDYYAITGDCYGVLPLDGEPLSEPFQEAGMTPDTLCQMVAEDCQTYSSRHSHSSEHHEEHHH